MEICGLVVLFILHVLLDVQISHHRIASFTELTKQLVYHWAFTNVLELQEKILHFPNFCRNDAECFVLNNKLGIHLRREWELFRMRILFFDIYFIFIYNVLYMMLCFELLFYIDYFNTVFIFCFWEKKNGVVRCY